MVLSLIFWGLLHGAWLCNGAIGDLENTSQTVAEPQELNLKNITTLTETTTLSLTSLECSLSEELQREGYETKEGKHYRLYSEEIEKMNHLEASKKCNQFGARLAMFKDYQNWEIVKSYRDQTNGSIWVGLVNTFMVQCHKEKCVDKGLKWIDGAVFDQEDLIKDIRVMSLQTKNYCMMMHIDKKGAYSVRDRKCSNKLPFLCQYDCHNPYIDTKVTTCPEAKDGFEHMYHGQTYMLPTNFNSMTFDMAQEKCKQVGGFLPTIYSLNKYMGAKVMAGWGGDGMWIGLKTLDSSVKCNSSLECEGSLIHVAGGDAPVGADWKFHAANFIDGGLDIDADEGECAVMRNTKPPYNTTYLIKSRDCNGEALFVCARGCRVECGPPKMVNEVMFSDPELGTSTMAESYLLYFDGTMFENIADSFYIVLINMVPIPVA